MTSNKPQLKLKIQINGQKVTLFKIIKNTETYLMLNASINSSKKNMETHQWDTVSSYFTCFMGKEIMKKLENNFVEKMQIIIDKGVLELLPDKHTVTSELGKTFEETFYTKATISIYEFSFLENKSNMPF